MSYLGAGIECCGIDELANIYEDDSPETSVKNLADEDFVGKFILFSDVGMNKYKFGNDLEKFIKKNKLGTVMAMKPGRNPNSGNMVKVWMWNVNKRKLKTFKTPYDEAPYNPYFWRY